MKIRDELTEFNEENLDFLLTNKGLEILCQRICNKPKIRFCGIVNSLGRLITGGFKDGIQPLNNEDQRHMLFIQSTLELSMKKEFNDSLGIVNFVTTYRDNVALITIPMDKNCVLFLSVERNADIEKIVRIVVGFFESNGIMISDRKFLSNTNSKSSFECV